VVSPSARRRAVKHLVEGGKCSVRRGCAILGLATSTFYKGAVAGEETIRLERRIKSLSHKHPRYGYRLIRELLRREGWKVNRKRVQRVRSREGLQVVKKARKTRRARVGSAERRRAERPNHVWTYDFVHDQLENGRGVKMLTVLDEFTRECLGVLVERSITSAGVVEFLGRIIAGGVAPEHVRSDNGPEFIARVVKEWAGNRGIKINYIEPGSPWENGQVESFQGQIAG
jgi:putative transposase